MRKPTPFALLVVAALVSGGCTTASTLSTVSPVEVKFPTTTSCDVHPKTAVIDYKTDYGKGLVVEWSSPKTVDLKLKVPKDDKILPRLEGRLDGGTKRKSDRARGLFGKWKKDAHGHKEYRVGYDVSFGSVPCDPEICIRKSGNGCDY